MKIVYDENGDEGLELNILDCIIGVMFVIMLLCGLAFFICLPWIAPQLF